MGILEQIGNFLFGEIRETTANSMPVPDPPAPSASPVTESTAITIDSVYRAVEILQTAAMQLQLRQYRGSKPITKARILSTPNPAQDLAEFIAETVASMALNGNAFWLKTLSIQGECLSLRVIPAYRVGVVLHPTTGQPTYYLDGKKLYSDQISHLKYFQLPGYAYGISPIQAASRLIGSAIKTEQTATTWLTAGGTPTGILSTDKDLDEDEAEEYKRRWNESATWANGVAVLRDGVKYEPIMRPEDIQFLEARAYDARAIARIFGIPAHQMLLGVEGSSMTYQNVQAADAAFIRWTLMAYLTPIERELSRILPNNNRAKFNIDGFLRATSLERWQAYQIGIQTGVLTAEEVREIEGIATKGIN